MAIRKIERARLNEELAAIGVEPPPYQSAKDLRILLNAERIKRGMEPLPAHPRNNGEAEAVEVSERLAAEGHQPQSRVMPRPDHSPSSHRRRGTASTELRAAAEFHAERTPITTPMGPAAQPYVSRRRSAAEQNLAHIDFGRFRETSYGHHPPDGPGACRSDIEILGVKPGRGGWAW